jgi:hypothetical protein
MIYTYRFLASVSAASSVGKSGLHKKTLKDNQLLQLEKRVYFLHQPQRHYHSTIRSFKQSNSDSTLQALDVHK